MRTTVLATGGGTGGHVYPALSIIQRLRSGTAAPDPSPTSNSSPITPPQPIRSHPADVDVIYIGNRLGLEQTLVPREGIPAYLFPMAAPRSPRGLGRMVLATLRSLLVVARRRPDAALATGGYVSVPVALAAAAARVPLILFLPDTVPGKAVALLAPLARTICAVSDDAAARLPRRKTVVTGYPVRDFFLHADGAAGRSRFAVSEGARMVLVFGGSQGARSLNQALAASLADLLNQCHVVHICGEARLQEAETAARGLPPDLRSRYALVPYLHGREMADAMAGADLIVCRSGASVIGELPLAGAPALLIPLPDPSVHQQENAAFLASRGAAEILPDNRLSDTLGPAIVRLLEDTRALDAMAEGMRGLARPDAAERIAQLVMEAAG